MKLCLSRYRFHIPKLERLDHINLHIRISCHHKKEKCHHTKSLWHNYMILLLYIFKKNEYLCRKCSQCSHFLDQNLYYFFKWIKCAKWIDIMAWITARLLLMKTGLIFQQSQGVSQNKKRNKH